VTVLLAGGCIGDGPAWYRVELPARWLRAHGVEVRTAYNSVEQHHIEGGISTFSTQRGWDPSLLIGILSLQAQGVRCIYEIDDDIWAVPAWSAARRWFTEEHVRGMEAVMRACDLATVSTERLASTMVRATRKKVSLIPNGIPFDIFPPARERTRPGVRVGWWGSDTHTEDLPHALPAMRRLLRECNNVTLVFMGAPLHKSLSAGPKIEWHDWVAPEEFYGKLRELELDVVVAPITDCRFNYAKSNIKVVEAAALGCAIVASDVGPYQCIKNGETGFKIKANRPDLWSSLLMDVVKDENLRAKLGAGARAWAEKDFSMDATGPLWAEAFGVPITGGA